MVFELFLSNPLPGNCSGLLAISVDGQPVLTDEICLISVMKGSVSQTGRKVPG